MSVRVCGAGLAAAQPPGMNFLPADGVAAPESLARGDVDVRVVGSLFDYPTVVIPGSRQERLPYDEGPRKAQEG